MKKIEITEDEASALEDIYKESEYKHPLLNPYQIYARQIIRKVEVYADNESYVYFNTRKKYGIGVYTAVFPIVTRGEYEKVVRDFLKMRITGKLVILHLYTGKEVNYDLFKGFNKEEYKYVINDSEWKENKKIRYYVKMAQENNLKVVSDFNEEMYKQYYYNCYLKTLETGEVTEFEKGLRFFSYLYSKGMVRANFAVIDNEVVAGTFILYDNESKIGYYIDAASSEKGKKIGANYLLLYDQINYFREKGFILDLGGVQPGKNKKWDNIFLFKQKWGKVVDMPLLVKEGLLYKLAKTFKIG